MDIIFCMILPLSMAAGQYFNHLAHARDMQGGLHGAKTPSLARGYPTTSLKMFTPTWPVLGAGIILYFVFKYS